MTGRVPRRLKQGKASATVIETRCRPAHGFQATARTLIVEQLSGVSPEVIKVQLPHGKSGPLGMAYDRAEFMARHRQLMTAWAAYLDRLRGGTGDRVQEGMTPVTPLVLTRRV